MWESVSSTAPFLAPLVAGSRGTLSGVGAVHLDLVSESFEILEIALPSIYNSLGWYAYLLNG